MIAWGEDNKLWPNLSEELLEYHEIVQLVVNRVEVEVDQRQKLHKLNKRQKMLVRKGILMDDEQELK